MRFIHRLLATLVAGVLAGGVLMAVTTGSANAANNFTLDARETNVQFNNLPPNSFPDKEPAIGDHLYIREDLTQNGKPAGFDNIQCVVEFNNNLLCDAVFALTNRGDITVTTLYRNGVGENSPTVFDIAITGGTFAFRSARGDIHTTNTSDNTSRYEFHLTS